MAAKTWEADFRADAIAASLADRDLDPDELFDAERSFCLPVAERPVVGWTPSKAMLVALVIGFAGLAAGPLVMGSGDAPTWRIVVGACCSLAGIATLFAGVICAGRLAGWVIGPRAGALVDRVDGPLEYFEAGDPPRPKRKMKLSVESDDHLLVGFDPAGRRLLAEGVAARYMIRGEDAVAVRPFRFMNYLGVEVTYRVGPSDRETKLTLGFARTSWALTFVTQVPILFFLRDRISNRWPGRFADVLGVPVSEPMTWM